MAQEGGAHPQHSKSLGKGKWAAQLALLLVPRQPLQLPLPSACLLCSQPCPDAPALPGAQLIRKERQKQ